MVYVALLYELCTPYSTHSNYNLTSQSVDEEYHDTQALDGVWRATWQLVLAMAVKGLITIFTFGIKVFVQSSALNDDFIPCHKFLCHNH